MSYQHSEDILEDQKVYIPKMNEQMTTATYRIVNAIDALNNLDGDFRVTVSLLLKSFLFTHKSIITILLKGNEEKYEQGLGREDDKPTDMTLGADAMSLVSLTLSNFDL